MSIALVLVAWNLAISTYSTATAPSPLDGRWVADLDTQADPDHADVYDISGGVYRCESCQPPRRYPADGKVRPVAGEDGAREAVTITGPRTIVTRIETPGEVRMTTMTAAPDDQTATYVSMDEIPGVPGPLRTVYLARRVAPTPVGHHPISGSWMAVRYVEVPEAYRLVELHEEGPALIRSTPTHGHYTAIIGGPPARIEGIAGADLKVTVSKPDQRTVIETIYGGDKIVLSRTYTVSPDGRSLDTSTKNAAGEVFRITSHRE